MRASLCHIVEQKLQQSRAFHAIGDQQPDSRHHIHAFQQAHTLILDINGVEQAQSGAEYGTRQSRS